MRLSVTAMLAILLSSAAVSRAADRDSILNPEQLVGAWKLVSGERGGKAMAKESTGGIFVFSKDTLTGKNRYGEELSWMSYTLDMKQNPVAMNVTITKGFAGETRDAIVEVRDGQLRLCYNLDKKGRPKEFATKDGDNNRSMIFVKSVDPADAQAAIKAASDKKWNALRDQNPGAFMELMRLKYTRTGPSGKTRDVGEALFEYNEPKNKVDAVVVSDQQITIYGDTAVETGRATATKKELQAPVWDIRYTLTWVKEDGRWCLVSEHQSQAK
jgi:uncharacterized protein (TIGR03067 family)